MYQKALKGVNLFLRCFFLLIISWGSAAYSQIENSQALLERLDGMVNLLSHEASDILHHLEVQTDSLTSVQKKQLKIQQARVALLSGEYEKSISLLQAELSQKTPKNLQVRAYNMLTFAYQIRNDFSNAFSAMLAALELLEQIDDPFVSMGTLQVAATAYRQLGYYDLSTATSVRMLKLAEETNNQAMECVALADLSVSYAEQENTLDSRHYLIKTKQVCQQAKLELILYLCEIYSARLSMIDGQYDEALDLLNVNKTAIEKLGYKAGVLTFYQIYAEVLYQKQQYDESKKYALLAVQLAQDLNQQDNIRDATNILMNISAIKGDMKSAFELSKKYINASETFSNEQKIRVSAFQMARHNNLDQRRQIEVLNQKNQMFELQTRLQSRIRMNLQIALALGGLLLAAILFWLYKTLIQRKLFRIRSETDALTGIMNRMQLIVSGERALAATIRDKEDFCIIAFDLDYFKNINDTFGHAAGDWALKRVSKTISGLLRKSDIFGRVGGEEFVVCLPRANIETGLLMAQKFCNNIANIKSKKQSLSEVEITASFGVTALNGRQLTLEEMMAEADEELYRAKSGGRNCVTVHEIDKTLIADH